MILDTCYSMHEVAFVYRTRFALPVELVCDRPCLSVGHAVDAAAVASRVGAPIREALRSRGVDSVPVISHDRPCHDSWIFLLRPDPPIRPPRPQVPAVSTLEPGTRVWLPTPRAQTGWHWVAPPAPATSSGQINAPTLSQLLRAAWPALTAPAWIAQMRT